MDEHQLFGSGLLALATQADAWRINYYAIGFEFEPEKKFYVYSITNASVLPARLLSAPEQLITGAEHYRYLVSAAHGQTFDFMKLSFRKDQHFSYEQQLRVGIASYVNRLVSSNAMRPNALMKQEARTLTPPYKPVSVFRKDESRRLFAGLETVYSMDLMPLARVVHEAHDLLVEQAASVDTVVAHAEDSLGVQLDTRDVYALRDAYTRRPEDFSSLSVDMRKQLNDQLSTQKWRPWELEQPYQPLKNE